MVHDRGVGPVSSTLALLSVVGAAVLGGVVVAALGVPGGMVLGGTLGATAVVLLRDLTVSLPASMSLGIQVMVGVAIGTRFTPETLEALRGHAVSAFLATILLIAAGMAIAGVLYRCGRAPRWIFLATSPGGIEALATLAAERDEGPVEVALFHFMRLFLVILSVPILLKLA